VCYADTDARKRSEGQMTAELRIEPVWHDQDLVEVKVTASNEAFSGAACVYIGLDGLRAAADELAGFPSRPNDRRRIDWGQTGLGMASLDFVTADALGHCHVIVELRTGDQCGDTPGQAVTVLLPVEPGAIDRFAVDLRRSGPERHVAAILDGAA
jgi:hypothetical protein